MDVTEERSCVAGWENSRWEPLLEHGSHHCSGFEPGAVKRSALSSEEASNSYGLFVGSSTSAGESRTNHLYASYDRK